MNICGFALLLEFIISVLTKLFSGSRQFFRRRACMALSHKHPCTRAFEFFLVPISRDECDTQLSIGQQQSVEGILASNRQASRQASKQIARVDAIATGVQRSQVPDEEDRSPMCPGAVMYTRCCLPKTWSALAPR
ncbi:hypothetical protein BJ166DRAFT_112192 [Pestalotiopsis sp. NC0098]|nr:hypothetical protein BJ166DRAFT_112192 [Pestalotiopsis sp. NC0098]